METELRKETLVIKGSNHKGRFDFSYSSLSYFRDKGFPIPPEAEEIAQRKLHPIPVNVDEYPWKTHPWLHQKTGMANALSFKRYALLHRMGAGKSKTALDIIGFLLWKGLIKRALIICPLSVIPEWIKQYERHAAFGGLVVIDNTSKGKKFLNAGVPEDTILLLNYEKVPSLQAELGTQEWGIVICDEATKIKSHRTKRTKAVSQLTKGKEYVIVMTGTPVSKNMVDIFGEYLVMDPFWFGKSFWFFRHRYCQMGGWMGHQIVGYQREEELRRIIDIPSHRVTKQEALPDLPPQTFQERVCEMEPEQKRIYNEVRKKFLVQFGEGEIDIKNAASRIAKLQEIADGFIILSGDETGDAKETKIISNSKVKCLIEGMEEVDDDSRITVWCRFKQDIESIKQGVAETLPERRVFVISGKVKSKDRGTVLDNFRSTPGSILICQIQTGGMGIDLTCSSKVFFFSNIFEYGMRDQAQDRHHRPGQTETVSYCDIVTEGTVDRKILHVLATRKSLGEWLMEGKGRLSEFFEPQAAYGRFR